MKNQLFIEKLNEILEEQHSSVDFTLHDLCEALNISRSKLHRILKDFCGQTTTEYINNFRVSKANEYLSNGNYKVKEVASMVGYHDPKYFSKIYAKRYGKVPSI